VGFLGNTLWTDFDLLEKNAPRLALPHRDVHGEGLQGCPRCHRSAAGVDAG